jgi:hypothetical protein
MKLLFIVLTLAFRTSAFANQPLSGKDLKDAETCISDVANEIALNQTSLRGGSCVATKIDPAVIKYATVHYKEGIYARGRVTVLCQDGLSAGTTRIHRNFVAFLTSSGGCSGSQTGWQF